VRDAMNRVKKMIPHNADYATQFDNFIEDEKEDTAAMQSVIPGYTATDDLTDDRGMFEAIKKKVDPNNLLQSQFQSLMSSLTRLPTDEDNGVKVWNLVSTLLQQISLGTGYLAVDGEFVLDVGELLNSNALRAELEMQKEDNKNLQQSTQEQIKKLKDDNRSLKDQVTELKVRSRVCARLVAHCVCAGQADCAQCWTHARGDQEAAAADLRPQGGTRGGQLQRGARWCTRQRLGRGHLHHGGEGEGREAGSRQGD
jgi:hypothetical protein